MGIIRFSHTPEEALFETYEAKGFAAIVQNLEGEVGKNNEQPLSVFVALEKDDFHDTQWHEVPGVSVSVTQPEEQLANSWSRVHRHMRQLHKPTLHRIK